VEDLWPHAPAMAVAPRCGQRRSDEDMTPFAMKHCRVADEPKVQLWWTYTLRHICTYIQITICTYGTKWIIPKITVQM
jgi:hypothetical protein